MTIREWSLVISAEQYSCPQHNVIHFCEMCLGAHNTSWLEITTQLFT
jgi:hypothetical protein